MSWSPVSPAPHGVWRDELAARPYGEALHARRLPLSSHRSSPVASPQPRRYVEKLEGGWSRVYYSADSQLPSWVPGFAKDRLIGQALRQSTSWVDKYAQLAVGTSSRSARPPVVLVLLRRLLVAAALVQAKVKMLPKLLPGIWLPPVVGRTADSALLALRGLLSRLKALRAC